jgi:plastocyanin
VRRYLLAGAVLALALLPVSAARATTHNVEAQGNVFTGGLAFSPAAIDAAIGDAVRWTNTDFAVPHTATEDHGLWRLTGTYGETPANPPGFGPGTSVERTFEAGTAHYYCEVHPQQMRGRIAVPVQLTASRRLGPKPKRRRGHRRKRRKVLTTVHAAWASAAPAAGQGFDVQVRQSGGDWRTLRDGTTDSAADFDGGRPGTGWDVRARLRSLSDAKKAEDYSPPASVTT